jgi:glucokinase
MSEYLIGVDLGGTNIRAAAVSPSGSILDRISIPTQAYQGRRAVVKRLIELIRGIEEKFGKKGQRLVGVGMGIAGAIYLNRGLVSRSPNLEGWENFKLMDRLQKYLDFPIFLENDANAIALGEKWKGAGKKAESFCCLTLGTGIGGGIILNNKIWHGVDGTAGEIGHTTLDPQGPPCNCGSNGCLEIYASATGIKRMVLEKIREGNKSSLLKKCQNKIEDITAKMVYDSAKDGDELCQGVFREMGRYLGIGLANLINLLNLELIVLGGKVTQAWNLFIGETRKEIKKRGFTPSAKRTKITKAKLGDDAGVLGAVYFALEKLGGEQRRRQY